LVPDKNSLAGTMQGCKGWVMSSAFIRAWNLHSVVAALHAEVSSAPYLMSRFLTPLLIIFSRSHFTPCRWSWRAAELSTAYL